MSVIALSAGLGAAIDSPAGAAGTGTTLFGARTPSQPTPRPGLSGAGPVLVLTDPTDPFSDRICDQILVTDGLGRSCAATDAGNLDGLDLGSYEAVVLADHHPLTATQLAQVTAWTADGGTFIALRPADNLGSLLGLGPGSGLLSDAYYRLDASQGLATRVLQYHGAATLYPVSTATIVARLDPDGATDTSYPAVTTRTVGDGQAIAYAFDPSRSILLTRGGDPALAGKTTTSLNTFEPRPRVADRFGNGWLDLANVAIPQADVLMHELSNQLVTATSAPRFGSFPAFRTGSAAHPDGWISAAFVLTGDDHGSASQTLARFTKEQGLNIDCSVADWECIRSTSYAYPGAFDDVTAAGYVRAGFEVEPHVADASHQCADSSTQSGLDDLTSQDVAAWKTSFRQVSALQKPLTERYHCYGVWRSYAQVARSEAAQGVRADTNSSCWPNAAFNVGQCLFTGTGLPMEYIDSDGSRTGVNQWTTQATDENPSTVSQTALDGLAAGAVGNGYAGYFTVLAHLDNQAIQNQTEVNVLAVAARYDIPVISAAQAETFWEARAATTVTDGPRTATSVTYSLGTPVHNLMLMVPATRRGHGLTAITRDGVPVTTTTRVVDGLSYALVPAAEAGTYVASYSASTDERPVRAHPRGPA